MTQSYSSQLKGWSIDRAIEIAKLSKPNDGQSDMSVYEILATADKLVAYAFVETEAEAAIREKIEAEEYERKMAEAVAMTPATNAQV